MDVDACECCAPCYTRCQDLGLDGNIGEEALHRTRNVVVAVILVIP